MLVKSRYRPIRQFVLFKRSSDLAIGCLNVGMGDIKLLKKYVGHGFDTFLIHRMA